MRAITVRQPWAWSIIHGGKDVENRSRNIAGSYRGPVAIHAGLQVADEGMPEIVACAVGEWRRANPGLTSDDKPDDPANARPLWYGHRGCIIGVVDLVDVHTASVIGGCGHMDYNCPEHETCRRHCSPWAMGPAPTGGWFQHLVFTNPRPLVTPIPTRGRLGLWTVPDDIAETLVTA